MGKLKRWKKEGSLKKPRRKSDRDPGPAQGRSAVPTGLTSSITLSPNKAETTQETVL